MKKLLVLLPFCALAFSNCKKSDSNTACEKTVATISGSYKITGAKYKASSSGPEIDFLDTYYSSPCEKDDVIILKSDGSMQNTDAGVACSPSTAFSSTWSISGNTIIIDGEDFTMASFNCSKLVVTQTGVGTSGDLLTLTYTKQ